jgi:hypothetical protein
MRLAPHARGIPDSPIVYPKLYTEDLFASSVERVMVLQKKRRNPEKDFSH